MAPRTRKLTEPLATITFLFGLFLAFTLVVGIVGSIGSRSASFGGFGRTTICATDTQTVVGYPSGPSIPRDTEYQTRPGAYRNDDAYLGVCTAHPGIGQRLLSTLTSVPGGLLLAGVLLMLWRLIRTAGRDGPFTRPVAALLRRLGWLIIVGTMVVAGVQELANILLINTMLIHPEGYGLGGPVFNATVNTIGASVFALFPERILIGGALLTFARIVRVGSAMDDEIKATV
jgi:Protein of unknown function (DUF2975)